MDYKEELNELIPVIYKIACDHGWHENTNPFEETATLIHCELSEAVEEYRACRPYVWFECDNDDIRICDYKAHHFGFDCDDPCSKVTCVHRGKKPEGIAIELIDAVIRILDFYGENHIRISKDIDPSKWAISDDFMYFVCKQHENIVKLELTRAVNMIIAWIAKHGLDPIELIKMKCEYNKTRPYKHGKRC